MRQIFAEGNWRESLAISFSQSRWARAVTEQPRTIIQSGAKAGSMAQSGWEIGTTLCPAASNAASMSNDSAMFRRQPTVLNTTFIFR